MNAPCAIVRPSVGVLFLTLCLGPLFPLPSNAAPTHELVAGFNFPPQQPGLGSLVPAGDGFYWGATLQGGSHSVGAIYKIKGDGSDQQTVLSFTRNTAVNKGALPYGGMMDDGAGNLWGTTYQGGASDLGTVFKVNMSTGVLTTVVEFSGVSGASPGGNPACRLTSDGMGNLWGGTTTGGANGKGTIFKINASTDVMTTVVDLTGTAGASLGESFYGGFASDGAGFLWGPTFAGGASNKGTLFKVEVATGTLTTVVELTGNTGTNPGANPVGILTDDGTGFFWGTCTNGGASNFGTVYKLEISTGVLTTLVQFTNSSGAFGKNPYGQLVSDGAGSFWGSTQAGGSIVTAGTVFKVNASTGALTTVLEFNINNVIRGSSPLAGLISDGAGSFIGTTAQGGTFGLGTVYKIDIATAAYSLLSEMMGDDGVYLYSGVAADVDGTLWGTTGHGGTGGSGTVFKIHPATGVVTKVVDFTNQSGPNKGQEPVGGLVHDGAGHFWGTTIRGGVLPGGYGTIFKINTSTGALTTLVEFTNDDLPLRGFNPKGELVNDGAGNFWGITLSGGDSPSLAQGTVYKINIATGAFTHVAVFPGNNGTTFKGFSPHAGLASDGAGSFWGTTMGASGLHGTVFKIDATTGAFTQMVGFTDNGASNKGKWPWASLVNDGAGFFWGTTSVGGGSNRGTVFKVDASTGTLTTLVEFTDVAGAIGRRPHAGLTSDGAGNFWGTTLEGGAGNIGTVFKVNATTGAMTTVLEFTGSGSQANNGSSPGFSPLLKHTDGNFYGTTQGGGPGGGGTVYRVRLGPTPATLAASGVAATTATLHGTANPNGVASTVFFEYGTSPGALTSSTGTENLSAATSASPVAHPVTGLAPGVTYYYRLRAENADQLQPQLGEVMSFTTIATPEIAVEQPADNGLTDGSITPLDFGNAVVGFGPSDLTFTIKNIGEADLTGLTITKDGTDEAMFTVTANPTAPVSGPSGSTTFTVRFEPTSAGVKTAMLHIASNDADEAPFDIAITGTGVAPQFGAIAFQDANVSVNEAATTINVPIIRTGGSDGSVSVRVNSSTGGATHADFNAVSNVLVEFGSGETSKTVPVTILNDTLAESNETFSLTLGTFGGGAVAGPTQVTTIRILDPDTTVPTVTMTTPAANSIHITPTVTITGTAKDNKGIKQVQISHNGGPFTDIVINPPGSSSPLNPTFNHVLTTVGGVNTIALRSIDHRNNISATVTRSIIVHRSLVVNVSSSAHGSVTAGYSPSSNREPGKSYTITATPKPAAGAYDGGLFTGWTITGATNAQIGIVESAKQKQTLTFIFREGLQLTANFMASPFPDMAGAYNGLIRPSTTLPDRLHPLADGSVRDNSTEGRFQATVQKTGAFSATMTIDGLSLGFSGAFDHNGDARFGTARLLTQTVARANKPSLIVALHMDMVTPGDHDKITGTVTARGFQQSVITSVSDVDSDRAFYNGTTVVVPSAYLGAANANGIFTTLFPAKGVNDQTPGFTIQDYPQGKGIGTVTITKAGVVTVTGTLADGSTLTATSALSQADTFPLFAQLYSKLGFLSGMVVLNSSVSNSDMSALDLQWLRPFQSTSQYYPYGWPEVIKVDMMAAKFVVVAGQSILRAQGNSVLQTPDADGNATLTFTDGRLSEPLAKFVNISSADVVTKVPENDSTFTLLINRTTGAVTGTFIHTDDTMPSFNAIIYRKGNTAGAHGFFLTKQPVPIDYQGESGSVTLLGEPEEV